MDHWSAVKRILRYLKGTLMYSLHLRPSSLYTISVFTDARWVSDQDDCRSQYGFVIYFGGSLISWTSRKQKVVVHSGIGVVYRVIAAAIAEFGFGNYLLIFVISYLLLPLSSEIAFRLLSCSKIRSLPTSPFTFRWTSTLFVRVEN